MRLINKGFEQAVSRRYFIGIASVSTAALAGLTGRALRAGLKRGGIKLLAIVRAIPHVGHATLLYLSALLLLTAQSYDLSLT